MCVIVVYMVVCMLWQRFTGVCIVMVMSSAYEVSAGGSGMSDVYMLKGVGERTPH